MDDDIERQAPNGDMGIPDEKSRKAARVWWCVGVAAIVTVVFTVGPSILQVEYFSGIDSVSGPDRTMGLSFNLTIGVTCRSHGAKAYINPGILVEEFYRDVQLASSNAETPQVCAALWKAANMHVVATATGVPVGHVLDRLTAEMRQGAAVFDFKLHVPANSYGGIAAKTSWLTDCKGTQVGHADVPCESPDQF